MKRLIITIATVACATLASAQSSIPIEISYDAAGNRITRKVLQISKMSRGSIADSSYYLDQMQSIQMKVYPNPTQGKVHVEISETRESPLLKIRILDNWGRLIHENQECGNVLELDISSYPDGYYIVELFADDEHTTWKIIKK